ncbi:hypothetical protein BVC80_1713g35 [Macleaya cordata]|uniref:Uncharacterized protein n=1 Tax=Macleaya cordata TaxID=56857 RepID=A0A200Q2A1_MACCD|nr:hypothetical protein BVC80_1713g35 [Macleaya cordata]
MTTVSQGITLRTWYEHWRMVSQMWTHRVPVAGQRAQRVWEGAAREEAEGEREQLPKLLPVPVEPKKTLTGHVNTARMPMSGPPILARCASSTGEVP